MKKVNALSFKKVSTIVIAMAILFSCNNNKNTQKINSVKRIEVNAQDILGNPDYLAMAFGGYRQKTRDIQPTVDELKEDMQILSAMGVKVVRTYHTKMAHASNVVKAIHELQLENPDFEMYVMMGAWINCKDAWTDKPDHNGENADENAGEIQRAIKLVQQYPHIIKILAVGNEAMVKWAATYYVQPKVILKYVNQLQELKRKGDLPKSLWITSSDNFASWGGGDKEYHTEDLNNLIQAVDYVSLHTYPMHDTHYNSQFWGNFENESSLKKEDRIKMAMERAKEYAVNQYKNTSLYVKAIAPGKTLHIGETGWASGSNGFYGKEGSRATDEYKEGIYYNLLRKWSNKNKISCFYFEAFDEPWKDAKNPEGSENHFGLFDVNGQAKYALWNLVDQGLFKNLSRGGMKVNKTYDGNIHMLIKNVALPPIKKKLELNKK